jgi:hypothetical protein
MAGRATIVSFWGSLAANARACARKFTAEAGQGRGLHSGPGRTRPWRRLFRPGPAGPRCAWAWRPHLQFHTFLLSHLHSFPRPAGRLGACWLDCLRSALLSWARRVFSDLGWGNPLLVRLATRRRADRRAPGAPRPGRSVAQARLGVSGHKSRIFPHFSEIHERPARSCRFIGRRIGLRARGEPRRLVLGRGKNSAVLPTLQERACPDL